MSFYASEELNYLEITSNLIVILSYLTTTHKIVSCVLVVE